VAQVAVIAVLAVEPMAGVVVVPLGHQALLALVHREEMVAQPKRGNIEPLVAVVVLRQTVEMETQQSRAWVVRAQQTQYQEPRLRMQVVVVEEEKVVQTETVAGPEAVVPEEILVRPERQEQPTLEVVVVEVPIVKMVERVARVSS